MHKDVADVTNLDHEIWQWLQLKITKMIILVQLLEALALAGVQDQLSSLKGSSVACNE